MAREQLARVHQSVLEVGAVLPLAPAQRGQLLRLDLTRVQTERHQVQVVARELTLDQRMQSQRDLLGGQEAAAVDHRPTEVQQQHRAGLVHLLGAVHLEV